MTAKEVQIDDTQNEKFISKINFDLVWPDK